MSMAVRNPSNRERNSFDSCAVEARAGYTGHQITAPRPTSAVTIRKPAAKSPTCSAVDSSPSRSAGKSVSPIAPIAPSEKMKERDA